ncbi:MAG: response regulator [Planctomycetota bacterium]
MMTMHEPMTDRARAAVPTRFPNEDEADQMLAAAKARLDRAAEGAPRPIVALVVEDDDDMRWCLADLLTMSGIEVDLAADGRTAMQLIARRRYALVISDLRLPEANGLMVARTARVAPHPPEVILITAFPAWHASAAREEFLVLHKPIDFRFLARVIAESVDRRRSELS